MKTVKTVLLIEDSQETMPLLTTVLHDLRIKVVGSRGILPFTDIFAFSPALILLDHWIANGFSADLCLEIKTNVLTKAISVIMMSKHSNIQQIAKKSRADGYLQKPVDLDDLQNAIKAFI